MMRLTIWFSSTPLPFYWVSLCSLGWSLLLDLPASATSVLSSQAYLISLSSSHGESVGSQRQCAFIVFCFFIFVLTLDLEIQLVPISLVKDKWIFLGLSITASALTAQNFRHILWIFTVQFSNECCQLLCPFLGHALYRLTRGLESENRVQVSCLPKGSNVLPCPALPFALFLPSPLCLLPFSPPPNIIPSLTIWEFHTVYLDQVHSPIPEPYTHKKKRNHQVQLVLLKHPLSSSQRPAP